MDTDIMMLSARLDDQEPYMEINGKEIMSSVSHIIAQIWQMHLGRSYILL